MHAFSEAASGDLSSRVKRNVAQLHLNDERGSPAPVRRRAWAAFQRVHGLCPSLSVLLAEQTGGGCVRYICRPSFSALHCPVWMRHRSTARRRATATMHLFPPLKHFLLFSMTAQERGRGTTRDKEPVFLIVVFFSEVLYSEVDTARLAWNTAARMKTPRA